MPSVATFAMAKINKTQATLDGDESRLPESPGTGPGKSARVSPEGASGAGNEKPNVLRVVTLARALPTSVSDQSDWLIDPRNSRYVPYWDLVMLTALLFTAFVTPYEIVFLPSVKVLSEGPNGLWVINRIVDAAFVCDMVIIFNMAYQEAPHKGGSWVRSRPLIALNYFQGWLIIDFVSVLPFYGIAWIMCGGDCDEDGGGNALASVRVVKLLRMIKLARMLKASRILKRQIEDVIMGKLEATYAVLKMFQLFLVLVMWSHWQACLWGLGSSFMQGDTWITAYEAAEGCPEEGCDGFEVYAAALYWSMMTVTSVGYGEMLPVNTAERVICSVLMLVSGCVWTYVLGTSAGIASTLDPNGVLYQNTMDQLNYFMRERTLPAAMRHELREFFTAARTVYQANDDQDLFNKMSPMLQGTVALAANRGWVNSVWYLRRLGDTRDGRDCMACLAKRLGVTAFTKDERAPIGYLYVVRKGMCVRNWRFFRMGDVWGEDIIMRVPELMDHAQAVALCFLEVYTLSKYNLEDVLNDYPEQAAVVQAAARRILVSRALHAHLVKEAHSRQPERFAQSGPKAFVPRDHASGFTLVSSELTIEQKLTALLRAAKLTSEREKSSDSESGAADSESALQLVSPRASSDGGAAVAEVLQRMEKAVLGKLDALSARVESLESALQQTPQG